MASKSQTQQSNWAHTDTGKAFMGARPFCLRGFLLPFYTHTHTHTYTYMCIYIYTHTHIYVCIIKFLWLYLYKGEYILGYICLYTNCKAWNSLIEQEIRHLHGSLKVLWAWCPMPTASNGEIIQGISEEEKPVHLWQSQDPATDSRPQAHSTLSSFCLKHLMGYSSTGGVCSCLLPIVIK